METDSVKTNITIILKQPRYPENIGAAARAMCNMGFSNLTIISPVDYDLERIKKTATHESSDIVDSITTADSIQDALTDIEYVVGTTARLGKQRKASTPENLSKKLNILSHQNRIAVLFGPEDRGLQNEDIDYCDALIHIPTFGFSSINLAQAVMIVCYELSRSSAPSQDYKPPRLAGKQELERMYIELEDVLKKTRYINTENPGYFMSRFRDFFSRFELRAKEVAIVRGLLNKICSYGQDMYQKGINDQKKK